MSDRRSESIAGHHTAEISKSLNRLAKAKTQFIEAIGHPDLEYDRPVLEKVQAARRAQAPGS